jgi:23S rRNA pseudouridine2605 synthase
VPAERLQKVLAAAGVASRRGADALIQAGRVSVDGRPAILGERVDPENARIEVDGRRVAEAAPQAAMPTYLAAHKPLGVTSTVRDRHAARTVIDLVPGPMRPASGRLFPVGRLDQDSEGLLLLTDDGAWAERVLHPRYGVEREYAVAVDRPLDSPRLAEVQRGIPLAEGLATLAGLRAATRTESAALSRAIDPPPPAALTWYRVTLRQGWKRQVRRMFAAVDVPVRRLVRVRIGTVRLADLRAGDVRALRPDEVRRLGRGVAEPRGS